jgi:SAM-dependent methyltransferase
MRKPRARESAAEAGCREHFVDAALYDYEYRHRRADLTFYRRLAQNRLEFARGYVLDLACGSGRLLVPLLRDGHRVVGLDRSPQMLAAAAHRVRRLSTLRRRACTLLRADLRAFAVREPATLAICAFHSVQHLLVDEAILAFLACARRSLVKGGWLAFDVLPPDPTWLGRDPNHRWARTIFCHPTTRQRLAYTTSHVYDPGTRLLHMRLYYQPVDEKGAARGRERTVRLCHRQYPPSEITRLLSRSGFRPLEAFADFDGRPLVESAAPAEEHVYVAVAV